jgi:hypothetical protein
VKYSARRRPGATSLPTSFTTFGSVRSSGREIAAASVAMSTAPSVSGVIAAAIARGSIVGRSP